MNIIKNRPPIEHRCFACNSIYEIESADVGLEIDVICGAENHGAPCSFAFWKCPVCGKEDGCWSYKLPEDFYKAAEARGVGTVEQALKRRYPNGYGATASTNA